MIELIEPIHPPVTASSIRTHCTRGVQGVQGVSFFHVGSASVPLSLANFRRKTRYNFRHTSMIGLNNTQ